MRLLRAAFWERASAFCSDSTLVCTTLALLTLWARTLAKVLTCSHGLLAISTTTLRTLLGSHSTAWCQALLLHGGGRSDNYPASLDCQWLDITDLQPKNSWYTYEVCTNIGRTLFEMTFDNNCVSFPVYIADVPDDGFNRPYYSMVPSN